MKPRVHVCAALLCTLATAGQAAELCATCSISLDFSSGGSIVATGGATLTFGPGGALDLGEGGSITVGEGGSVTPAAGDMSGGGSVVLGDGGQLQFGPGGSLATGEAGAMSVVEGGGLDLDGADAANLQAGSSLHFQAVSARNVSLESDGNITDASAPFRFTMTESADAGDFTAVAAGDIGLEQVNSRGQVTVTSSQPIEGSGEPSPDGGYSSSGSCIFTSDVHGQGQMSCSDMGSSGGSLEDQQFSGIEVPAAELRASGGALGLPALLMLGLAGLGRRRRPARE